MNNNRIASQNETAAQRRRVVLLGASNLTINLPTIVETMRALVDAPLDFYVAQGFGRSFGQESKFFWKKFSGILQCNLWSELDRAAPAPTFAIIADVGNDLAYEAPVDVVVDWVREASARLAKADARVVVNNVPIESLRRIGRLRFRVMRRLLFPKCRLSLAELQRRAEQLSSRLAMLAESRKTPIFSGSAADYGWDPIHPRRAHCGEIWRQMIGALGPTNEPVQLVKLSRDVRRIYRRLGGTTGASQTHGQRIELPRIGRRFGATISLH